MKINLVLNHIIKILLVSLLCIMLLIGSIFVIPPHFAFADSTDYRALFAEQSFSTVASSPTASSLATSPYVYSLDNTSYTVNKNNEADVFVFAVAASTSYNFYFVSETRAVTVYYAWSSSQVLNRSLTTSDSVNSLYYNAATLSASPLCPVFDDINEGLAAVRDYIDNPSSGGPEPRQAIVTIEPGYVAYIGITGGHAIFTATFNKKQPKGTINSNIRYGFSSSRPAESSTITMDGSVGSSLPFVTDRPFDIWGKSFNGRYGIDDLSASYLIVYVPLTDPDGNTNATVKVALSEYLNSVQFPLSASMVGGDIVSTGNSDEFYISDSSMLNEDFRPEYVYSNAGVTSTAISIPVGGNNLPPTTGGGSLIEQFTTLLSDLINRIESLLIAPVEYIKWIISSSSNFMAWLSAIWTWLPEPVYTTIVSVLLILVVVGALKLLWR